MVIKTIKIDEGKCVGCGLCASACRQSAIVIQNGKAKLVNREHCDGLGRCLPMCPHGAISFNENAVLQGSPKKNEAQSENSQSEGAQDLPCGCPGSHSKAISRYSESAPLAAPLAAQTAAHGADHFVQTHLNQWPVQIVLVPPQAPYFANAKLLVAADCTAFSYGNFHGQFMKGKITLIGCPKLDSEDYSVKLTAILKANEIKSVTVARMEVPCCAGIVGAVKKALADCGKLIPWQAVVISTDGEILDD